LRATLRVVEALLAGWRAVAGRFANAIRTALRTTLRIRLARRSTGQTRFLAHEVHAVLRAAFTVLEALLTIGRASLSAHAIVTRLRAAIGIEYAIIIVGGTRRCWLATEILAIAGAACEIDAATGTIALTPNGTANVIVAFLLATIGRCCAFFAIGVTLGPSAEGARALL